MNSEQLAKAQQVAKDLFRSFVPKIEIGMDEMDLIKAFLEHQKAAGHPKNWHPPKIRIGKNTLYPYNVKSTFTETLHAHSFLFIDIGVIVEGYESDYGESLFMGGDHPLVTAGLEIWQQLRDYWFQQKATGKQIYQLGRELAVQKGLELDCIEGGHPIGKFPHSREGAQDMSELDETPREYQWILEVKLIDHQRELGSFYEDMLK